VKVLNDWELLEKLIEKLEKRGVLRKSYADFFRKVVKSPTDILFSQAVDPEEFAKAVAEILKLPYNDSPIPIEVGDSFFGETVKLNFSEIFHEYKVPIQGGVGVLIPLPQHTKEENLQIISFPSYKKIVSEYVKTSPAEVEEKLREEKLSEAVILILLNAVSLSASDIHIDPFEKGEGYCSFRIDGDLSVFCSLGDRGERIINTIFTLANLYADKVEYSPVSIRLSGEQIVEKAKNT